MDSSIKDLIIRRIDSIIRFFICVMVVFLPLGIAVVEMSIGICIFLWLVKRIILLLSCSVKNSSWLVWVKGFKPVDTSLNLWISFFLLLCLVSSFFGVQPLVSLRSFYGKIVEWFVVFFIIIEFFDTKERIHRILYVFILIACILSFDGLIQFYWLKKDVLKGIVLTSSGQVSATFSSANSLGIFLALAIPISIVFLFESLNKKIIWLNLLSVVLMLWVFVLTVSRGAWLALTFSVILTGITIPVLTSGRLKSKNIFIGLVGLLVIASIFVLESDFARAHFFQENTGSHRITMWEDSFKMLMDRPILGFGVNTFMKNFQFFRRDPYYFLTYAHNCYLQMLVEIGIVGFSIFVGMVIVYFRRLLHNLRVLFDEDKQMFLTGIGVFASLVAFFAHSFVDVDFYSLPLARLWWVLMGIGVAIGKLSNKTKIGRCP
ncbi:MAG: O-antigen ligase family protein [Candidatus Omnitrophica bacterium]|nr:O-antigen ligase family protein [Candidatus Omnitrophota bacterium]